MKNNITTSSVINPDISTKNINKDEQVKKYNQTIGFASKPIKKGDHIHTQSLHERFCREYNLKIILMLITKGTSNFEGIVRKW